MDISVIIPAYNEEENVNELYSQLTKVLKAMKKEYEIIFIEDGSTDNTFKILKDISKKDNAVKLIRFQGNFGKAAALAAGFEKAKGDFIITMDADIQDDPKEIPRFFEMIKDYDLVSGWKYKRHDPLSKRLPSKFFNWLTGIITGIKIHDFNCGFKIYRKDVVKNIKVYGELHRYIPALAFWHGYKVGEMKVEHHKRKHGKSKYGFTRLFKGFFDLITVRFLMNFSKRPMHFFGILGLLCFFFGTASGSYLFYLWLQNMKIGDRPLLILTVLLIVLGIQFISIGLLGEMVVSNSSQKEYIIREELN